MRFGAKGAARRARPQTNIGMFLRSYIFEDDQTRQDLNTKLNGGQRGWNADEPAVVEAVCSLAVRRLFWMGYDAELASRYVEEMFDAMTASPPPANRGQTQAIIQAAFGEPGAVISGLPAQKLMSMRILVFVSVCATLRLRSDERVVNRLIADAEQIAFEQGWNPPLAEG
jgi:hypothetical protein